MEFSQESFLNTNEVVISSRGKTGGSCRPVAGVGEGLSGLRRSASCPGREGGAWLSAGRRAPQVPDQQGASEARLFLMGPLGPSEGAAGNRDADTISGRLDL